MKLLCCMTHPVHLIILALTKRNCYWMTNSVLLFTSIPSIMHTTVHTSLLTQLHKCIPTCFIQRDGHTYTRTLAQWKSTVCLIILYPLAFCWKSEKSSKFHTILGNAYPRLSTTMSGITPLIGDRRGFMPPQSTTIFYLI